VRRYLRELRDHYDDAVQDELNRGASRATAEEIAASRLGDPDRLVQSALARPELRSTVARWPRLTFGVAPVLLWLAAFVAVLLLLGESTHSLDGMWAMYVTAIAFARIVPVLLALTLLAIAYRQRLPLLWPIVGGAVVAILAGTLNVTYVPAQLLADSGLGIDSSLLPFFFDSPVLGPANPAALALGAARAAIELGLTLLLFLLWSRRQKSA